MTSVKYRVVKKIKGGTSLPLSIWLHSSNQSHVSELSTKFLPSQGFFRLNWEKFELTVHVRNHLNRMKHMSPDHSLDFDIRHRPYTNMHLCKEGYLTYKNSLVYMPNFAAAGCQFNDVLRCMFFRHQHRHKVVSFYLSTTSIRWREFLHCHKSFFPNVRSEICPLDVMRQVFGRRRKLVTFLVLLEEKQIPHLICFG